MITEYFINIGSMILAILVDMFPSYDPTIVTGIKSARDYLFSYVWWMNWIFPVQHFLYIFQTVLVCEALLLSIKITRFLLRNLTLGLFKG